MITQTKICLVVALGCEAQPLIQHYQLKKVASKPFHFYQAGDVFLVVSGSGKSRMAAAVGWLGSRLNDNNCVWLNIGSAGHASLPLGSIVRIHGVQSSSTKPFYPPMLAAWKGESKVIRCVDEPSSEYHEDGLVDMESAAFFEAARLFAEDERIQSLKIVSDNAEHSFHKLTPKKLTQLIEPQCESIVRYATALKEMFCIDKPAQIDVPKHLHCTQSQRHQFDDLVRRLFAVSALRLSETDVRSSGETNIQPPVDFTQYQTMRELLSALSSQLKMQIPSCNEHSAAQ